MVTYPLGVLALCVLLDAVGIILTWLYFLKGDRILFTAIRYYVFNGVAGF